MKIRGRVEDTKLEAKAKDTKNPSPRPRTGMLEAKAKDQGHKRKCFPKKKGLKKKLSVDLKKKRSRKTFFSRSTKF